MQILLLAISDVTFHSCGKEKTISEHLVYAVQKLADYNEFRSQICKRLCH